jgi:hypothetical protein
MFRRGDSKSLKVYQYSDGAANLAPTKEIYGVSDVLSDKDYVDSITEEKYPGAPRDIWLSGF